MTATAPRVVVIGVGNTWRRDDGAGPAVATALRPQLARSHPDAGRAACDGDRPTSEGPGFEGAARPTSVGRTASDDDARGAGHRGTGVVQGGGQVDGDRHVQVFELDGEAARLVDAWDGAELAVVVDAVRTGAVPGTVHRFDIASDPDDRAVLGPLRAETAGARSAIKLASSNSPVEHTSATRIGGATGRGTSSHGLGVAHAVELGCVLGRLPRRLIVVGIEGADFGPGADLTAAVADAVEPAARLVADLIDGHPTTTAGPATTAADATSDIGSRTDPDCPAGSEPRPTTSSHGIGVAQAMDLATPAAGLATDVVEERA